MAKGINKVTLIGNLGRDPKLVPGSAVCKLSLATTESRKDNDGNWQDETEWHRVTLFGHDANSAAKHLRKGSMIYVEGKIHYDSYEKDGIKRYTTDIIGLRYLNLGKDMAEQQPDRPPQQSESTYNPATDNDGNGVSEDLPF